MTDKTMQAPQAAASGGKPGDGYSMSGGLVRRLATLGCSVAFTSYQSGLLYMLGVNPGGGAHLHQSAMPKPMGLSYDGSGRLLVAAGYQVMEMANVLALHERINGTFGACFVPRQVHNTGQLDAHDVGRDADGRPIFVATRFNCIATVDVRHSFSPIWRPPFISGLVDEDRCHLNGLAIDADGQPAYATAVSKSDTIDGWRDRRMNGGVLIDIRSGELVLDDLSMPHSPRLHQGKLWLLNSGTGEFGFVSGLEAGASDGARFEPVAFCPGFLRGLSFHGHYAFVGLSKPRYKRFEGLALDDRLRAADSEPWCGVQVIDTRTGHCVDWFRIDGPVAELYDVEVLPGVACPMTVSPGSADLATLITYEGRGTPQVRAHPDGQTQDAATQGSMIADTAPRATTAPDAATPPADADTAAERMTDYTE